MRYIPYKTSTEIDVKIEEFDFVVIWKDDEIKRPVAAFSCIPDCKYFIEKREKDFPHYDYEIYELKN